MAAGLDTREPQLASAVVFVHGLDESADFYQELLNMEVTVRTATAVLLVGHHGFQVYLRAVARRPLTRPGRATSAHAQPQRR
ncbi:VOC family protein [Streptomyces sp. NPDC002577]